MKKKAETVESWSDSVDWDQLREEFFYTTGADGEFTYKSLHDFARAKYPTNPNRRTWLVAAIGPGRTTKYVGKLQWRGDWIAKRLLDETRYSEELHLLKSKIDNELDLLGAGQVLANSYLPFQNRIFRLYQEFEAFFGTKVMRQLATSKKVQEKLTEDQIDSKLLARFKQFTNGLNDIIDLKMKVDNQFLRSLGWDRPQFLAYFMSLRKGKETPELNKQENRVELLMVELVKNQIEKAKMYELPMPEDFAAMTDIEVAKEE